MVFLVNRGMVGLCVAVAGFRLSLLLSTTSD